MIYSADLILGDSLSDTLNDYSEEVREEPGYIGVWGKKNQKQKPLQVVRTSNYYC